MGSQHRMAYGRRRILAVTITLWGHGLLAAAWARDGAGSLGEVVTEIDKSCWVVFQDQSNNYWFGSDGRGVCRYDGKTITRFTTKDGLSNDHVRGIQQHAPTGDILITTNEGVSKFDGKQFVTLPIAEAMRPAAAAPSISEEGWTLNPNDVWLRGVGGPRRYDGTTLYQLKFPKSPLEEELSARIPHHESWSPYDVWTVYKDRKGQMWFGTGMFGVCRFDGRSLDWMFEPHLTEVPGAGWFGFRSIVEDRNGDFWFCNTQYRYKIEPHGAAGQEVGKLKYAREKGIDFAGSATTDKYIYYQSITEDDNRDLWMAPYGGGVWKYDGKNVTHYPMQDGKDQILMISIYKDNGGQVWVGTQEAGAYRFTGKSFERFKP
ncbi:MAG: two-component regulator propeller domain-containing protein [Phycisphaerae bacterium]|nr:two-component regulator propeller domain-containing protein [Phycisphaerae bacterium]